jgi:hypothetical protein
MRRGRTLQSAPLAALAAGALTMAAAPADAHHAINAIVDTGTEVVSTMTLTRVDWINPHSWFHFSMKTSKGKVLGDVMIEWASLAGMRQSGYGSAAVFPLGDTYVVTYNPNRDGSPGGHMVRMVDQTDGTVYDY